jgi:succinate dehydrogenase / fumarate reductase cytochrome b subunit
MGFPVTTTSSKPKRASLPVEFYRSAVGKKWVMAVTGVLIIGFALAHMLGNLKMFLPDVDGVPDIDIYAESLRKLFSPIVPEHVMLWLLRVGLAAAFLLHMHAAYALTVMNHRARAVDYQSPRNYVAASYASRTMRWSGVIFLAFIIFHLADFTLGIQPAAPEGWEHGRVYANFLLGFQRPFALAFYTLAVTVLAIHLFHGAWSMFQSMGINHPRFNGIRRAFATALAAVLWVGFLLPPYAVAFGFLS